MLYQMVRCYTFHLNIVFVSVAESKHRDRGGFETIEE